jgi:hypothetical protein
LGRGEGAWKGQMAKPCLFMVVEKDPIWFAPKSSFFRWVTPPLEPRVVEPYLVWSVWFTNRLPLEELVVSRFFGRIRRPAVPRAQDPDTYDLNLTFERICSKNVSNMFKHYLEIIHCKYQILKPKNVFKKYVHIEYVSKCTCQLCLRAGLDLLGFLDLRL